MQGFDEAVLQALAQIRSPILNRIISDISSLGSVTLITIQAVIAGVLLALIRRNKASVWQVGIAAGGSEVWIESIKRTLRRSRPDVIPHLTDATGFSHPSGHAFASAALYVTLAMIVTRRLEHPARAVVWVTAGVLICLVSFSRVYLGVHYLSDSLVGAFMGAGWALVTAKLTDRMFTRG